MEADMDPQGVAALHHHRSLHAGSAKKKNSPCTGQLSYFIFEGVLTGVFGKDQIYLTAWSGGVGGSRKLKPTDDANNPYSYGVKEVSDPKNATRGGPIPPGPYRILPPGHQVHLGLCARLEPQFTAPNHRGGFAIHGQGPKGSDGCIVIPDKDFHRLMDKLAQSGGGHLHVCETMDDGVFV
jgi:hypothetical protein